MKMQFEKEVAQDVGTDAAIILSNIEYWVEKNTANNKNYHKGYYWTYNSLDAFCTLFDYLTPSQIRTCLKKLLDKGYIKTGKFNKARYDRTTWYTSLRHEFHSEVSESADASAKNDKCDLSKLANGSARNHRPIPDNKPNRKPDSAETRSADVNEEKKDTPMNCEEFYTWTQKSKQKHVRIIGEWADTVKPPLETEAQWQHYISRNARTAVRISVYTREQMEVAYEKIKAMQKQMNFDATLETLEKKLIS